MKNPAPYRYDIVGSFLRTKAIHEARSKFEAGEISAEELTKVEDAEITGLVKKEENVGLTPLPTASIAVPSGTWTSSGV